MIKKLSKIQIIIIFAIFERIKGTTEIELILSRLNKIENNQKLIIGTIRKQRGQIQQLDAALNIKQVNTHIPVYSKIRFQCTVVRIEYWSTLEATLRELHKKGLVIVRFTTIWLLRKWVKITETFELLLHLEIQFISFIFCRFKRPSVLESAGLVKTDSKFIKFTI